MKQYFVSALAACAALSGAAQADEVWDFGNGEQLIYETEIDDIAVFRLNDGAHEPMWLYIAGGLAGNDTDRTGTYTGFWVLHFDGAPETEAQPCSFTKRSPDGRVSGYWGVAEVEFSAPAFPSQLSLRVGHCFDAVSADTSEHAPISGATDAVPAPE